MSLNLCDLAIKYTSDKKAKVEHDAKPKSLLFAEKSYKFAERSIKNEQAAIDRAQKLEESIEKQNYPKELKEDFLNFLKKLDTGDHLLPDLDVPDVWYTDYYDLIQFAQKLGLGDTRLLHWHQEPNLHSRYLELSKNEIVKIFISVMNILVDEKDIDDLFSLSIDWDNRIKQFNARSTQVQPEHNI